MDSEPKKITPNQIANVISEAFTARTPNLPSAPWIFCQH